MKSAPEIKKPKGPVVTIDPALDKYEGKVLFSEKLDSANKMLLTAKLPPKKW